MDYNGAPIATTTELIDAVVAELQKEKPNDRSVRARLFAIMITEAEKLQALYYAWRNVKA